MTDSKGSTEKGGDKQQGKILKMHYNTGQFGIQLKQVS